MSKSVPSSLTEEIDMSRHPLSGITVVDLGQIYQGPYCTLLLALAGARVIKVEPRQGEPARRRADAVDGSFPLAMLNSNKEGITLNLKHGRGRELFLELVRKADVVVENFAPGVMEKLGLDAKFLLEQNERLVYGSASGYGSSGPYRDYLAMDLTVQAMSGVMSVTGFPDGAPVKAGPAVCDFLGGTHLYAAIVTALYDRSVTGKGRIVEVAMQDATFPTLASSLGMFYATQGREASRTGNRHSGLAMAPYNVYKATDGFLAIICVTEEHWKNLARAMGRPELAEHPEYATHTLRARIMEEVDALVGEWVGSQSKAKAFEIARAHRVPAAPVRDIAEVVVDPQMFYRGMLQKIDHPELGSVTLPHSPLRFAGSEAIPLRASPKLGQHTSEVLTGMLGLDAAEIERLHIAEVI
ncbi:MAG: CoA transferase [Mesorhizobium sp.]|nr:MAG: CoA transferase [Mesorhizobium sp.]